MHDGHFAGMMLDPAAVDADAWPFRLPGAVTGTVMTHLEAVGTVLAARAERLRCARARPMGCMTVAHRLSVGMCPCVSQSSCASSPRWWPY